MTKEITWSPLGADGSFSFKSKRLSNQDAFYQLHLNHKTHWKFA
ncbi:hypothetical protein [Flavivirga jejuensis]|uniref:Uncharacterized protein n=1 Tax=Flavivirga jejuensis TaxID=870487 RepID=A0ABT8WUM7_9FLAO|nr:hypothetical protein [Flavivirga jejuensis]MDO5976891.1 hypothetical protein [Flavivirga jejuensis]